MAVLEFPAAVLCDEVRKEESGRAILIGASNLGPSIDFENEGQISRLALYVEARITGAEQISIRLRHDNTGQCPLESDFDFSIPSDVLDQLNDDQNRELVINAIFVINQRDVDIPGPGIYHLEAKVEGEEWVKIRVWEFPEFSNLLERDGHEQ